jgi:hypothetical protein
MRTCFWSCCWKTPRETHCSKKTKIHRGRIFPFSCFLAKASPHETLPKELVVSHEDLLLVVLLENPKRNTLLEKNTRNQIVFGFFRFPVFHNYFTFSIFSMEKHKNKSKWQKMP